MSNLEIIKKEFDELKGQLVLVDFEVKRFIGIVEDEWDYYYCLYDGRKLVLHSILIRMTPLKGVIPQADYEEMVRICKLNHYDQPTIYNVREDMTNFNQEHKDSLLSNWDESTKFICDPEWELN